MKILNKSKKGVTLVELVIACVIMVLLGGACTAVIVSGQKLFISGSQNANAQLEANIVQTAVLNSLPRMDSVAKVGVDELQSKTEGLAFSVSDSTLTIWQNGSEITVNNIKGFQCSINKAGDSGSDSARAQFSYTLTLSDNVPISGGLVLNNTVHEEIPSGLKGAVVLNAGEALYFFVDEDTGEI